MRTVKQYILEEMGIEMPKGEIPESWFKENNLPKEIYCACCGIKMELQLAMVEDGGLVFCKKCEKSLASFRPSSISLQEIGSQRYLKINLKKGLTTSTPCVIIRYNQKKRS